MGKGSTAIRGRRGRYLSLIAILTLLAGFSITAQRAHAASVTYYVNSGNDTHNTGGTTCHDAQGHCSVRAAVEAADAQPPVSTVYIMVPHGTYVLTLGPLLFKYNTIYVYGAGMNATIIKSNGSDRVMENGTPGILPPTDAGNLTLQDLTITNGNALNSSSGVYDGGGVLNSGNLSIIRVHITNNVAANGGGLALEGNDSLYPTTSNDSTIDYNIAVDFSPSGGGYGGGILNTDALTLQRDHVDHNTAVTFGTDAPAEGGGLYSSGNLTSTLGTFNLNQAIALSSLARNSKNVQAVVKGTIPLVGDLTTDSKGGGIFTTDNQAQVTNAEISSNQAGQGGGVYNEYQLSLSYDNLSSNKAGCAGGGSLNPAALDPLGETPTIYMATVTEYYNTVGYANNLVYDARYQRYVGACEDEFLTEQGSSYFPRPMSGAGGYNDGTEFMNGALFEQNYFVNTSSLSLATGASAIKSQSDGYVNLCGFYYTCGGGLYAGGVPLPVSSASSEDTMVGVKFVHNQANAGVGGGVFEGLGTLTDQNGVFIGNRADYAGGGIFDDYSYSDNVFGTAHVVLTNTLVSGNTAGDEGGGIWNYLYGQVLLNGGTLTGNTALRCPNWYNGLIMNPGTCS